MDREEFSRRFEKRQSAYLKGLLGVAQEKGFSWINYIGQKKIEEDGFVSHIAEREKDQENSDSWESFENYVRFISGQGFTVEVNIEWSMDKTIFHVSSWEDEDEIEWPETINSGFIFRWVPVSGPKSLGL
ncbi:hypothetical protein [Shewanella chilikensis]|uniref:hypothetical protein n=1 Tax=Shewanella chilikensis TaxID=558541 RepID=UPI00399A0792